jgi:molecular chaperone DnaK (HSP70)
VQNLFSPVVVKLMDAINALLAKHKTRHQDIDEILLAGFFTKTSTSTSCVSRASKYLFT